MPANRKGPVVEEWQTRIFGADDFPPGCNFGLRLTQVTDVDLDCSEALALADIYLPPTGAEFGRASKPRSHRLFLSPGASFAAFADPLAKDRDIKATLLELREAAGIKPSFHPQLLTASGANGTARRFTIGIRRGQARRRCAYLAMGCLLARYVSATLASRRRGLPDFIGSRPRIGSAAYR